MNIKLHTPKSLKTGSGMATSKQFMLSLLATTVSIVLTFGTAAVIDYNKKQKEKHAIVMMVMYDMYNSLRFVEKADSMIHASMDTQLQIAEDTSLFQKLRLKFVANTPRADFTETTEHIYSSNIETINTVGNVLFTENVAEFYQNRKHYKEYVCDSIWNVVGKNLPFSNLKGTLDFEYNYYAVLSFSILLEMQHQYAQCKQMMDVSEEDINVYRKEREKMEQCETDMETTWDSIYNEIEEIQYKIDDAKNKLKLK